MTAAPAKQKRSTGKNARKKPSKGRLIAGSAATSVNKQLAPSFSTGGGGVHFEAQVQASFVILMLTRGYAPGLRPWPIEEVKLQGKIEGYETDDCVVTIQRPGSDEQRRLLAQIKYSCALTSKSTVFGDVLRAHWLDYTNPAIFTKGADALALVTGPLRDTDIVNVHWLLRQARATGSADEFRRRVTAANFSPPHAATKLAAFRRHLEQANGGGTIDDETLWDFLRHFHLLSYDLGGEFGVVLPLLHSHMAQFNLDAQPYWGRAISYVATLNPDAGVITRDTIPDDIREAFTLPQPATIPPALTSTFSMSMSVASDKLPPDIAVMLLIGAFDESNPNDVAAVAEVFDVAPNEAIARLRNALQSSQRFLVFTKATWRVEDRKAAARTYAAHVFPDHVSRFVAVAKRILSETSSALHDDLDGVAYGIADASLPYSSQLRRGIVEGLALLGNFSHDFVRLPEGRNEQAATQVVNAIFANADWQRWATLSALLPVLAEAAPLAFLNAADHALERDEGPLRPLLARGKVDLFQNEYLSGLLWALEAIAWEPRHFGAACLCLARLVELDGTTASTERPASSLTTILLPWRPQTLAGTSIRIGAVVAIRREYPATAFSLLLSLLPARQQTSSGTHKPKWHPAPISDEEVAVTPTEYHDQVARFAALALELAANHVDRLLQLVQHISGLAPNTIAQLLDKLDRLDISMLSDESRLRLWTGLNKELAKHRRFLDAAWALPAETLTALEAISGKFAPLDPMVTLRPLFGNDDLALYDSFEGDFEQKRDRLAQRRVDAVNQILGSGIASVIEFTRHVRAPHLVGNALARCANESIDHAVLPALLVSNIAAISSMAGSYSYHRFLSNGVAWVDSLGGSAWTPAHWGTLLASLPIERALWERARGHSVSAWRQYWAKVVVTPFVSDDSACEMVEYLLEHDRAVDAVEFLDMQRHSQKKPDPELALKALAASLGKATRNIDEYHTLDLLKYVQASGAVDQEKVAQLEFALLPLLWLPGSPSPITLERQLAIDPQFYCDVIRMVYRSDRELESGTAEERVDEAMRMRAENAWRLLDKWRSLPGMENGAFDGAKFLAWLKEVRTSATASGHLETALDHVGRVLAHAPAGDDGLWIDATLAQVLDGRDSSPIREGYRTGVFNARGTHWVDPSGEGEFALSRHFSDQADSATEAGYLRLATTLRELAAYYDLAGKQIKEEHVGRAKPDGDVMAS